MLNLETLPLDTGEAGLVLTLSGILRQDRRAATAESELGRVLSRELSSLVQVFFNK